MSFKIILSTEFEKQVKGLNKKYPSLKSDLAILATTLKADPFSGTPIGKNCYKIRVAIASKGKGKSGGARVITCVKIVQRNIFLLSIYDKSEKDTISDRELVALLADNGLL